MNNNDKFLKASLFARKFVDDLIKSVENSAKSKPKETFVKKQKTFSTYLYDVCQNNKDLDTFKEKLFESKNNECKTLKEQIVEKNNRILSLVSEVDEITEESLNAILFKLNNESTKEDTKENDENTLSSKKGFFKVFSK